MNDSIKYGISNNGGIVLTDMPIKALEALRDSVDAAIRNYREQERRKHIVNI